MESNTNRTVDVDNAGIAGSVGEVRGMRPIASRGSRESSWRLHNRDSGGSKLRANMDMGTIDIDGGRDNGKTCPGTSCQVHVDICFWGAGAGDRYASGSNDETEICTAMSWLNNSEM